jgi:hypothetical protein
VTRRQRARPFVGVATSAVVCIHQSTCYSLHLYTILVAMDDVLRPPQLDELGLPLGWDSQGGGGEDVSDEMMQRFVAGDFSDLNLPQPSSFPTPAEVQREA